MIGPKVSTLREYMYQSKVGSSSFCIKPLNRTDVSMSSSQSVWTEPLRQVSPKLRKALIAQGPVEVILSVCELALNYTLGRPNLNINPTKRQSKFIEQIADRTISVQRKRRFLVKPVGVKVLRVLLS